MKRHVCKLLPAVLLLLAAIPLNGMAQNDIINANPIAILLSENNEYKEKPDTLAESGSVSAPGPLVLEFRAMPENAAPDYRYEWLFAKDTQMNNITLRRYDENTEFTFDEYGTFYVQLNIYRTENESAYSSSPFAITVTESMLELPNAFSPNGDGINDTYKVKHKSLVAFDAYIFNRWGQQLYHWNISNIDEGWDGTYKGRTVKNGVYFIMVKAEGTDGVKYQKKSDINILTGTNGETNTTSNINGY